MDEQVEEARISIHCGGTDIYIVPNGKSKRTKSSPQEIENHTEQELPEIYSAELAHVENKEAIGKIAIGNGERHLPPYTNGHTNNGHVNNGYIIKTNGKKNGNFTLGLEKGTSTELEGNQTSVGSIVDIIEHDRLQETITESEQRCRTILEEIKDAYFEVDLYGNFTVVNDALCGVLGRTAEELIGTNFRYHVVEKDAEAVYRAFNEVFRTGKTIKKLSYEVIHKDGTTLIAETSASPLKNARGQVIGFRGIGHDITERRRTEETIKWSENRYRTLLDEIEECYYEVDLAGDFIFVNNSICRQFGYTQEELVGVNFRLYVPDEDVDNIYKTWNKVYQTGEPLKSYHFATIKRGKEQIFLENSVSLLRDNEGKAIGFRSICRDVTELKQFMQTLAELTWPPTTR
ncbi:MAG: PAS domain-containing protein [Chloroflexota bacterium]|nr:MAG: PAS domain-containing protein [Chloroflexota bacterium]